MNSVPAACENFCRRLGDLLVHVGSGTAGEIQHIGFFGRSRPLQESRPFVSHGERRTYCDVRYIFSDLLVGRHGANAILDGLDPE